jgi:hypothetical protein
MADRRPVIRAPEDRWRLLGELLQLRRSELGYRRRPAFTKDRDINIRLVADIENAYRPNTFLNPTLQEIAQAYQVTYDSIVAVLGEKTGRLTPVLPAVPQAAGPGSALMDADRPPPPMLNEARIAADRPYYERIMGRVDLLRGQGIADPAGTQVFPDSPVDGKDWDDAAARWDISDRAWMIADLQRRAALRDDGTGQTQVTAG